MLWLYSLGVALRREAASRGAFVVGILMMMLNDAFWIGFWFVFMHRVDEVRGWGIDEILTLFAVFALAVGFVAGILAGVREIGRMYHRGDYDVLLAQPRAVLPRILSSRITPMLIGDMIVGPVIIFMVHGLDPAVFARYLVATAAASLVLLGFLIAVGATVFWLRSEEVGDLLFMLMTVFGMYPAQVFGGPAKLLVYTIVPSAFIATIPAQFVIDVAWADLAAVFGVGIAFTGIGVIVFQRGLRRYQLRA